MKDSQIDPQLEAMLESLRQVPPRDPLAAEAAKVRYLAELEQLELPTAQPWWRRLAGFLPGLQLSQEAKVMTGTKMVVYAALALFLVVLMLTGGAVATAYAAQSALPGDALYFVKTGMENTRIRLAGDAAAQAQLHLEFAEERLDEIERLIDQKRYDDIAQATQALELNIQQAIEAFQIASQGDPKLAADLAGRIAEALARYADALSVMLAQVPEAVRPQMERALSLSSSGRAVEGLVEFTGVVESQAPESWVVGGQAVLILPSTEIHGTIVVGDLVEVHAVMADDGSLTAIEIKLESADDDNANDNSNDNLNENVNDNANLNENDNQNGDDNDNANDNQSGSNDNDNDDDDDNDND